MFELLGILSTILFTVFFSKYFVDATPKIEYPCENVQEQSYDHTVNIGQLYMKQQRVIIAGLARDIVPRLPYLIPKLEKLGNMFLDYRVVISENDSKDKTRKLLLHWATINPKVIVLGCGVNASECQMDFSRHTSFDVGATRIGKMAYLRNNYLNFIKKYYSNYNYMIVFDYDILGSFYLDGIANSFYYFYTTGVDAIGANSIDRMGLYYDPFALVEIGEDIVYSDIIKKTMHDVHIGKKFKLKRCDAPVKVRSCFAGLAIYKISSIMNKEYGFTKRGYACEHSFFNDGLNMLLNPSMIMTVIVH